MFSARSCSHEKTQHLLSPLPQSVNVLDTWMVSRHMLLKVWCSFQVHVLFYLLIHSTHELSVKSENKSRLWKERYRQPAQLQIICINCWPQIVFFGFSLSPFLPSFIPPSLTFIFSLYVRSCRLKDVKYFTQSFLSYRLSWDSYLIYWLWSPHY